MEFLCFFKAFWVPKKKEKEEKKGERCDGVRNFAGEKGERYTKLGEVVWVLLWGRRLEYGRWGCQNCFCLLLLLKGFW